MCEKTGKLRQKLLFLQFMQCSLYNDCFLLFRYGASIHLSQYYGKTAFFLSGTLGWNRSNTFMVIFCHIPSMWQKITMSSCNKIFKQVLSFLSNLTPASLKVLKILKWKLYGFSRTALRTRSLGVFYTSKTIDVLNLKKPFWVFLYSPRDKTFMGFPCE